MMGLEGVEMVMAVEAEFGVEIPDADAAAMQTVRDLTAWLTDRLGARASGPCRTRRAFHRLRAALVDEAGLSRAAVRPQTPLDALLPGRKPAERWAALGARLGRGWYPRRRGWMGDVVHELAGEHRGRRYTARRAGQTVGDTARDLAAWDPDLRPAGGRAWDREAVALTVRRIIHDEFAEFGFAEDARFVKDLGFD